MLLPILVLAVFLRLYQVGAVPHGLHPDEAMNGGNALQVLETGRPQIFYPENNGREGLFINVQTLSVAIFGNDAFALRLPAAIFGILTVWGVYLLTAELICVPAGLLASFFLATSYWHLNFSRIGLRAIAAPCFLVWALYLLVRAGKPLDDARGSDPTTRGAAGSDQGREHKGAWAVLAGIVYGLGFHTYITYRVTPVLIAGILIYYFFRARATAQLPSFWKLAGLFTASTAIVVSPLMLYFLQHPTLFAGRSAQVSILNGPNAATSLLDNVWKTAQMFWIAGDPNWRHNYAGEREVYWPVALLFACGLVVAIAGLCRRGSEASQTRFAGAIALGWLILAAIPAVLSDSAPHALRALLMTPAVFILAAVGGVHAWPYLSKAGRIPRIAIAAVLIAMACYQPYHTYFDLWATNPKVAVNFMAPLADFAERIRTVPATAPRYIAATYTGDLANGIPVLLQPFAYLTRTYTPKQQNDANLHYLTPDSFHPQPGAAASGKSFCDQAKASLPQAEVLCVNLRSAP